MRAVRDLSKDDSIRLSLKIRDDIYLPSYNYKTSIFLCGANMIQTDAMRYRIAQALTNSSRYWYMYDIIYPEDIFEELLYSSKSKDLLSLEGLLADSVDAIVLVPESPGAFAELGAFANNEVLRNKLICVVDQMYKKKKSFINQGPLKLVKKHNSKNLIYIDPNCIEDEIKKIATSINRLKKVSKKRSDKISLLQLDNFILPSIFLLQPVSNTILMDMVGAITQDEGNTFQITTTILSILIKQKKIVSTTSGYKLTTLGIHSVYEFRHTGKNSTKHAQKIAIDNLRLEILNLKYRGKRFRM